MLGHEFVGRVLDGPPEWRDQRVVGEINFACGACTTCAAGLGRHCPTRSVMGIQNADGAIAEQVLVPLAMPLMAGPGAITTVLTFSSRAGTWRDMAMLLMAVTVVGVAVLLVLLSANRVGGLIGYRGQRIFLRFMGLILAAVGAEVLLAGVYTFVPR